MHILGLEIYISSTRKSFKNQWIGKFNFDGI